MIMKANKQIGFIYKDNESIDKILKDGNVVFERGFLREKTSTTLPITFDGVGKDLKDYKIYGNTYQNSTTSKNLLNYIDTFVSSGGGLTNVINDDGSITTTGIPTSNYRPIVGQYDIIDDLEDGQTYTISSETLNQFLYIQINAVKIAGGTDYIYNSNTRTQTFTVDKSKYNAYNIKIQTSTTSGWGSNSRTITNKYQLEKGATATEFEPYTGGQPSPNPDYPQEIISCGDKTSNLFSSKMELGTINDSGENANSENAIRTKDYIEVNPNTTYTMSNDKNYRIFLYQYDENNDYVTHSNNYGGYITFTTASNTKYVKARTNAGTIENDLTSLWKLAEGSTVTPYEPYGYKIPVNVRSENLFNMQYANAYIGGENARTYEDKNTVAKTGFIKCKPNTTYSIKKFENSDRFSVFDFPRIAVRKDELNPLYRNNDVSECTVTTNADAEYLYIYVSTGSEAKTPLMTVVEGSTTPSKYIPYYNETTNIYLDEPLRKIGEYSDYIDFINGKVVRNITEFILDGTRTSDLYFTNTSPNTSRIQYIKNPRGRSNDIDIFCNQLIGKLNYNADVEGLYVNGVSVVLRINKDKIGTSITTANKYFSVNSLILNYILETPTEEDIELPNIPTVDGNNTLNIETEITPSQVYIKYKSNT